jgi:hypothetical protein
MSSKKTANRNSKAQKNLNTEDFDPEKYQHDAQASLRAISNLLELLDRGYDFSTREGQEILAEVSDAMIWLAKALNIKFDVKDRRNPTRL